MSSRDAWGIGDFALGISLSGNGTPDAWSSQLRWLDRAEALGLHSVWVPEMHFNPGACSTPLVVLAAFAARTQRLRLATSSLLLPIHDPAKLACELATLQQLSGGRCLIGLGRGFRKALFDAFGIDPREKRDRFDAVLDAVLQELGDAAPPLAVAAFGPKGLEQAARRALPYIASPLESLELLRENQARHRAALPPGCDPAELVVPVLRTAHVAGSDAEARRVLDALEAEQRRVQWRPPKAMERAFEAPLEERVLVGTRNAVEDQLAAYREGLGLDLLIVNPRVAGAEPDEQLHSLGQLAELAEQLAQAG